MRYLSFIAAAFCAASFSGVQAQSVNYHLIEVRGVPQDSVGKGVMRYDSYSKRPLVALVNGTASLIVTDEQADSLRSAGYSARNIDSGTDLLPLYRKALYGESGVFSDEFLNYEKILKIGADLQSRFPDRIQAVEIGKTTSKGTKIVGYRISNNARELQDRPAVLLNGVHHADEILGAEILVRFMQRIVENYETDAQAKRWLDELEVYIIPVVNVDGYERITSSEDPRWRKVPVTSAQKYPEGIDPNRTYDYNWNLGGDGNPLNNRYRGEHPWGISETKALADFARTRPFVAGLSYHSQGEVLFFPWAWGERRAPDHALIEDISKNMAAQIRTMDGLGTYGAVPGAATVGQSYPWLYARLGLIDIIVETGKGSHVFPPEDSWPIINENLKGLDNFMDRMLGAGLSGKVTDTSGNPLKAEIRILGSFSEELDPRYTREENGRFWRLLQPGQHDILVLAPGFEPYRKRITVENGSRWTQIDIQLTKK